ncbi:hypothetical protein JMF97_21770 [Micromonospora fiedleri]|uniref:Uncharacterized protein n=1 Tax=Micromonospora fiedleri TaxID=1157498 RepID=A0ABS1UR07_9ACTN|nr:hypothetical protein [Micromonospora fiedleri]MBL6278791.1 hypothetical protein [Micromonospora fiedleri]
MTAVTRLWRLRRFGGMAVTRGCGYRNYGDMEWIKRWGHGGAVLDVGGEGGS